MRSIEIAKRPPAGASPERGPRRVGDLIEVPDGMHVTVPPPRERWEYTVLPMRPNQADNLAGLNRCGAEGWELVQVLGLEYWMKRKAG
jgi:hypothetical protein